MGYGTEAKDLRVTSLDPEMHERTCGYWYTVTSGALAHTAFATRQGLDRWLTERNLRLSQELPATGEWGGSPIVGTYRSCTHMSTEDFDAIVPVAVTATLSNGDYTRALITEDENGVRTVHCLNPNVKTRVVFDYAAMRKALN